ncbi:hypothetical protein QFZ52_002570 [Arthrobacter woluwensis]|uniref:DUF6153 family protein n=1 Tax=Arthrobacter woluwensis TaxID=156980 RepID=UPI00278AFB63|nr:DUF6153 family protein [Arthrobacter woluwensis]MDQ0709918.1 hypothetical protein [Arthrobacter woluwensis]
MTVLKRLLLVLGVVAGLLGMHPLAGLPLAAAHSHAAAQPAHDDGAVPHAGDGSPSEATAPCDGPAPCHTMAGTGSGCVPLPGGQAPGLVAPAQLRAGFGMTFRELMVPASPRGPGAPSLVELCISRT